MTAPTVAAVSVSAEHGFSKFERSQIELLAGIGVHGDAHAGTTVRHRSRVARDPSQPNLRQVHLLHAELLDELAQSGFDIEPGALGENILTRGLSLLSLPRDCHLIIGEAVLQVTGLRNPCGQIEAFRAGLLEMVVEKSSSGSLIRKAGVMAVVVRGGLVRVGDEIRLEPPLGPALPLEPV